MTTLSSHLTERGYSIREHPRGPLIGYVRSLRLRSWEATCSICSAAYSASRRTIAARQLGNHWAIHQR